MNAKKSEVRKLGDLYPLRPPTGVPNDILTT